MLLVFLLFSFLQQSSDLIRILEATRHELTVGTEESGKGVNYEIRLVAKMGSAKLKFVSIMVDQQGCTYKITNVNHPRKGEQFQKGDTLLISALLRNQPNLPSQKEKPYPVIGITYKETLYYFPIRQGIPVSPKNYP